MEYHKIETLYERDPATFKVRVGEFKNRTYTLLKHWRWTEKIDGTNIRVTWERDRSSIEGICPASVTFGGKSENAQIHADLYKVLQRAFTIEKLHAVFPDTDAVLYGEGYGAGIQKGGGAYSPTKNFILFDVLVDGKWWLSQENVEDVAAKLGIDVVPDFGFMTLEEATELVRVGFKSKLNGGLKDAEGLIGRPEEALFDKKGARLIVKLKTKDFPKQLDT
jgi:hypothetical protein